MGIEQKTMSYAECNFCNDRLNEVSDEKDGYTLYVNSMEAMEGARRKGWKFYRDEVMCSVCIDRGSAFSTEKELLKNIIENELKLW